MRWAGSPIEEVEEKVSDELPTPDSPAPSGSKVVSQEETNALGLLERFENPPEILPLEERLTDSAPRDHSLNLSPETLPPFRLFLPDRKVQDLLPVPSQPMRQVTDSRGRSIHTRVPIREGGEVDFYLDYLFEYEELGQTTLTEVGENQYPLDLPKGYSYLPFPTIFSESNPSAFKTKLAFLRHYYEWTKDATEKPPQTRERHN